jgi:hypothetical protein
MHKSATKCNETVGKWCKNKHGASKIIDTLETYHRLSGIKMFPFATSLNWLSSFSSKVHCVELSCRNTTSMSKERGDDEVIDCLQRRLNLLP